MKFAKIKNLIGTLAPTIGTALGSPLAGMAANVVAEALGCKPEAKSIEQAIQQATPEQMLELKKAETDFEIKLKELDVDIFALETADIQDARTKFNRDWTPRVLGFATILGFLGYIFLVTLQPPDANSDTIVSLVLGYLGGLASAVISFYFGASHTPDKNG